jgi:hypothetical protein
MWKIEYSKEVRNYLYDSYPYTETVWQTIKALRHQVDGLPPAGSDYYEIETERFVWDVAAHTVVYERRSDERSLFFAVVKPSNDDWL